MKRITRFFRRIPASALIDFPQLPKKFDWKVTDISPGGCKIKGNLKFIPGQIIECILTIPHADINIAIPSKVVWSFEGNYGIEFQNFPPGEKLRFACAIYRN